MKKGIREKIKQLIRKLFEPYAQELNFTDKDWKIFEARINGIKDWRFIEKKEDKNARKINPPYISEREENMLNNLLKVAETEKDKRIVLQYWSRWCNYYRDLLIKE